MVIAFDTDDIISLYLMINEILVIANGDDAS